MTAPPPLPHDWESALDRRLAERRENDRERHRTILAMAGALVTVIAILVSLGVAWGTATAAMSQKVDRFEQIRTDAAFDARITSNSQKLDNLTLGLGRLQAGIDSANARLRQMACQGRAASCR